MIKYVTIRAQTAETLKFCRGFLKRPDFMEILQKVIRFLVT